MFDRFTGDASLRSRGHLIVGRNKDTQNIISVDIEEDVVKLEGYEQKYEEMCQKGEYYQLEIPSLSLMTSMDACYYFRISGLNDTLTFSTNAESKDLIGMNIMVKDIKHLASLERNPRKKRLMLARQFEKYVGKAVLSSMVQQAQPYFDKTEYDTQGGEYKT